MPSIKSKKDEYVAHLFYNPAEEAIEFYKTAFDAYETFRIYRDHPGKEHEVALVELNIGLTTLYVSDKIMNVDPTITVKMRLETPDEEHALAKATRAGAKRYEDAPGLNIMDPFGIYWGIHKVELPSVSVPDIDAAIRYYEEFFSAKVVDEVVSRKRKKGRRSAEAGKKLMIGSSTIVVSKSEVGVGDGDGMTCEVKCKIDYPTKRGLMIEAAKEEGRLVDAVVLKRTFLDKYGVTWDFVQDIDCIKK